MNDTQYMDDLVKLMEVAIERRTRLYNEFAIDSSAIFCTQYSLYFYHWLETVKDLEPTPAECFIAGALAAKFGNPPVSFS